MNCNERKHPQAKRVLLRLALPFPDLGHVIGQEPPGDPDPPVHGPCACTREDPVCEEDPAVALGDPDGGLHPPNVSGGLYLGEWALQIGWGRVGWRRR